MYKRWQQFQRDELSLSPSGSHAAFAITGLSITIQFDDVIEKMRINDKTNCNNLLITKSTYDGCHALGSSQYANWIVEVNCEIEGTQVMSIAFFPNLINRSKFNELIG